VEIPAREFLESFLLPQEALEHVPMGCSQLSAPLPPVSFSNSDGFIPPKELLLMSVLAPLILVRGVSWSSDSAGRLVKQ